MIDNIGIISVALVLIIGLITGNIWYAVIYNIMMILKEHIQANILQIHMRDVMYVTVGVSDFVADAKNPSVYRETIIITWLIALTGYLIIVHVSIRAS